MRVYLAGPISGKSYDAATDWRNGVAEDLRSMGHVCSSPMRGKEYLSKEHVLRREYSKFPMSTAQGIYRRDTFDVDHCDVLLAYLLEAEEVSIGTVMEIQRGYDKGKYVLVVMKPGSIHDHAFVKMAASLVVGSLSEALEVIHVLGLPYEEHRS